MEGQGLTIAEALLAGKPVVAANTGGIPDLVVHERTGLLVSPGAPEEIAEAVKALWNDTRLRESLAEQGRRRARARFTRGASAAAFADLFNHVRAKNE